MHQVSGAHRWLGMGSRLLVPRALRRAAQRILPLNRLKLSAINTANPLSRVVQSDGSAIGDLPVVGIIRNQMAFHTRFVKACQEMGCAFRVIDLESEDWLTRARGSGVDFVLAWPDAVTTDRAKVVKDRCDLIEEVLGIPVYPTRAERWMYEDKVRLADWLRSRDVPHPRTWVFFDRVEALEFANSCILPVVFKLPFGAGSTGVQIVRSRRRLKGLVRRAFGRGLASVGHDLHDRQRGSILLQEYLPEIREWRLVHQFESPGDAFWSCSHRYYGMDFLPMAEGGTEGATSMYARADTFGSSFRNR